MRILTEKPQEPLIPKPTILKPFDLFKRIQIESHILLTERVRSITNSTESQLNQNAQSFEHTTGKRTPCGLRNKENPITDGHDRNQVERDGRGYRCTYEAQTDRTGAPYYVTGRLAPDSDSTCKYYLPRSQFRRALIGAATKTMCVGTANKPGS